MAGGCHRTALSSFRDCLPSYSIEPRSGPKDARLSYVFSVGVDQLGSHLLKDRLVLVCLLGGGVDGGSVLEASLVEVFLLSLSLSLLLLLSLFISFLADSFI